MFALYNIFFSYYFLDDSFFLCERLFLAPLVRWSFVPRGLWLSPLPPFNPRVSWGAKSGRFHKKKALRSSTKKTYSSAPKGKDSVLTLWGGSRDKSSFCLRSRIRFRPSHSFLYCCAVLIFFLPTQKNAAPILLRSLSPPFLPPPCGGG